MEAAQKIAVLTDSCSDVPTHIIDELGIYVVAMHINYHDASYRDRVDIQPEEVYERFSEEVPRTSTPSPAEVAALFDTMVADGVTHVVAVTISSGLSATHDLIKSVATGYSNLSVEVIDTKNIGLGSGFTAIEAGRLIQQGVSFDEVVARSRRAAESTSAFFCMDTLEYLYRGGRIGRVTYSVGSALDVRPVITCDNEGKYITVARAHGRKASLKKALAATKKQAEGAKRYRLAVVHGGAPEEARKLLESACEAMPDAEEVFFDQISPALVVHSGPGFVGVGVQVLER